MQPYYNHYCVNRLKECLSSGRFGTVHRGLWRVSKEKEDSEPDTEPDTEGVVEVGVKSLGSEVNEEEKLHFLKEAIIMGQLDHTGVLRIFGSVININGSGRSCYSKHEVILCQS